MSDESNGRNADDVAPGFMDAPGHSTRRGVLSYFIGLVLAALLTGAAFAMVGTPFIWAPAIPIALSVLAVAQIGVHLVFFLHLTTAPDNTNTALVIAFGVLIVALIIGGSIWIMNHLNHNMLPEQQIMQMQGLMQMQR
ncbi:MAG TPA: cytochrome o ubiquinol oxidase subunit IV [Nitrococcus sp.]|nr:cytochrome o ubiquinol oxidase subunit IV [Nitrococcus sp.]